MKSKLDPTFKLNWINALKSGEYEKGKSILHDSKRNTYCCLGVVCAMNDIRTGLNSYIFEHMDPKNKIPRLLIGAGPDIVSDLVNLNDNNETWDEVIKYIEKNL